MSYYILDEKQNKNSKYKFIEHLVLFPFLLTCALIKNKSGRKRREIKYLRSLFCLLHYRRKSGLLIIKVDNFTRSFSVDYNCGDRFFARAVQLPPAKQIHYSYLRVFRSLLPCESLLSNFLFLNSRGS